MKEFTEEMRYEYDLNKDSFVVDAGGYEGFFAREINIRYGCNIIVLEPISEYLQKISLELAPFENIRVLPFALSNKRDVIQMVKNNNSSGQFQREGITELVNTIPVTDLMAFSTRIDLLKLNIEGSEFDVLESMINNNIQERFTNIQVQFHKCAPEANSRCILINTALNKTHEITWKTPHWDSGWTNYRLR